MYDHSYEDGKIARCPDLVLDQDLWLDRLLVTS